MLFLIMLIIIGCIGCADNVDASTCMNGHTYGFFGGTWHGIIALFDLIGMLFSDQIAVYAPNNTGFGYALGFLCGDWIIIMFLRGLFK